MSDARARDSFWSRFALLQNWVEKVLVDDVLLVRNGEEMAAFRLAAAVR